MYYGTNELDLLLHPLAQLLYFAVPPRHDVELLEPLGEPLTSCRLVYSFEACQVDGLLPHLHFAVQTSLLGQVTNACYIRGGKPSSFKKDLATIGGCDAVDNTYKGGLAGSIGAHKTEYRALGYRDGDIIECQVTGVPLDNMLRF